MPTFNNFAVIANGLKAKAHEIVEQTAIQVVTGAARRSRYDTSPGREDDPRPHMRDSWTHEMKSSTEAEVSNPTPQTVFNEYGTTRMPAAPMLTPAMDEDGKPYLEARLPELLRP